jgi:dihydrofolate reductase
MGRLIYLMNVSLDGYIETTDHSLAWTTIDDEIHGWFNDQLRNTEALLYGRRLYEGMAAHWPTAESDPEMTPVMLDFARIWNPKPKIVFSRSLERVEGNARLVRAESDEDFARMKAEFDGELEVCGPTLAAEFIRRGLVDEYRLVVHPVILGAGTPYFPRLERPLALRLTETRTFASGVVYLGYTAT